MILVQVQNKEGINPWHEFLQAFGSRKTHSYSLINKSITSKNVFHYITSHSPHPIAANTACTTLTASTEALCPPIDHTEVCTSARGCASHFLLYFSRACATQVVVLVPAVRGHRAGGSVHQMLAKLGTQKTYN